MKKSSESKNVVEQLLMPIPLFTVIAIVIFASMLYMKNNEAGAHVPFFSQANASPQQHYTLNINNPGCELIGPNGNAIKLSDKVSISKGVTISSNCLDEE